MAMQAIIDSALAPPPPALDATPLPTDARTAVVVLYRQHHDSLVRLAALVAPDPSAAEDLVQDAFLRLHRTWSRVDPDRAVGYVRTTIVNLARGQARRSAVVRRFASTQRDDDLVDSAEDSAMGHERRKIIRAAIRRLPARQRECLVLRHYAGLTESEIATELGISIGSVRKHTHRAMRALDTRLEGLR